MLIIIVGAIITAPLAASAVQNIFINHSQIIDIQVGNDKIDQVYIGSTLVWERYQTANFGYTGSAQTFTAPCDGYYQIELWGASGGSNSYAGKDGKGAYTKGTIYLTTGTTLFAYIGQTAPAVSTGGWNGGGNSSPGNASVNGSSGGGATDIRLSSGTWNNATSLRSRIMVAGAGGGSSGWPGDAKTGLGGSGGGLTGYNGDVGYSSGPEGLQQTTGGTQVSGGTSPTAGVNSNRYGNPGIFGIGGNGAQTSTSGSPYGAGAGGGYYGGGGGGANSPAVQAGGGGSSYISGHTGAVAITSAIDQSPKSGCTTGTTTNSCSTHYSGKIFTSTKMIDGAGYAWTNTKGAQEPMPNPSGGNYASGIGHTGNGAAKITFLNR